MIRRNLLALVLLCTSAMAQAICPTWRGTVFQIQQDGTYTLLDNQVLYAFDVAGIEESWTFGNFGADPSLAQTISVWYFEVDWFGLDDCQFSLGYNADQIFHNEFD